MNLNKTSYWSTHLQDLICEFHALSRDAYIQEGENIIAAAKELGFQVFQLDCKRMSMRDSTMQYLAEAFQFPEWFGRNWDAVFDLTTDFSWRPGSGYLVILLNEESLEKVSQEIPDNLASVLEHTAEYWHEPGESALVIEPPVPFHLIGVAANNKHPLLRRLSKPVCDHAAAS